MGIVPSKWLMTYDLFNPIIALSDAEEWNDARLEWRCVGFDYDDEGTHCICTHFIKNVFFLENVVNGNRTIVGNHCIIQFEGGGDLPKVHRALRKGKVNAALIAYAHEAGIINDYTRDMMNDTWRAHSRRSNNLSQAQIHFFDKAKRKIYRACQTELS